MTAETHKIPTGTLKQVPVKDIKVGERFRERGFDKQPDWPDFVESIREKGVLQAITLSKDLTLLAGERRLTAVLEIGFDKIPALVREIEGDLDLREIELIENTFRQDFKWHERAKLVAEIYRLYKSKSIDWSGRKTAQLLNRSAMGVSRDLEIAQALEILPQLADQPTASDAFKMVKKFQEEALVNELRSRQEKAHGLGQANSDEATGEYSDQSENILNAITKRPLWDTTPTDIAGWLKLGDVNYKIGDVFESLSAFQDNGVIDIIECDPPYGIDLTQVKGSKDNVDTTIHGYQEVAKDAYPEFLEKLAMELYRVAAKDAWLIFWYGPTWHQLVFDSLESAGWKVDDIPCIWVKSQGQTLQPEHYLARQYEPFFLARKGQPIITKRGRANVFQFDATPSTKKYHPTERPLALIEELLNTIALPRQTLLVPFLGSGATLRAAYRVGLKAFGYDINAQYKDRFMLAVEEDARNILLPKGNENANS